MKHTSSHGEPQRATPDHNWTLERLTSYVKERLKDRDEMREHLAAVGRRSTVELFRAGQALHFLRDKLKADKAYVQWLEDNGIARSTAHEAIKLYYKAKTEDAVEKMTITEAKVKFGVVKNKKTATPGVPKKSNEGGNEETHEDRPTELTTADTVLIVMARKLEEIVQWDRTDLDAHRLDGLARQCIKLLETFLVNNCLPKRKRRVHHAA